MAEYKISDLETLSGIKAHTIRIWEKRYGLLNPERTDTKIRTYSDKDLLQILNIALLNKNGYKISKIADMEAEEISRHVNALESSEEIDVSLESLILSMVELDEDLFSKTLNALINSKGLEMTFSENVIPFLDRIGVMWQVGSITPAQEHFMSNLIRQKVISAINELEYKVTKKSTFLLYLPEHEWHELSLLFYQYVLKKSGFKTYYMGQSLPYESLVSSIQQIKPNFIITSWLTSIDLKFIVNYFSSLKKECCNAKIYAGGYQVNINIEKLNDSVCEIRSYKDLQKMISHLK
jgi:DNA-binding transcriptional MerR regulator